MRRSADLVGVILLSGCASLFRASGTEPPYIDRRVNGNLVTYRHLSAPILADAIAHDAVKFCKERGLEANLVARAGQGADPTAGSSPPGLSVSRTATPSSQRLTSYECRTPRSAIK